MPGLWKGAPGLGSGFPGLNRGIAGLWGGFAGLALNIGPVLDAFDASFNPSPFLVYSESDRLVTRTNDIIRLGLRGATGRDTGKWYVELLPIVTRLRFAGIVDGDFQINGGPPPPGRHRVGIEGSNLIAYPNVTDPIGQFAAAGTVVRIAYDADNALFWLKLGNGMWNDSPTANPATGVGGLSAAGLDGPGFVGVTLRPVTGAGVRIRMPGDPGYSLPSGFAEWTA
jgi:hypothetical protein